MAVVIGGVSDDPVPLDYKFEVSVPSDSMEWEVGKVVLSDTFTHDGDSWQLGMTKRLSRTNNSDGHYLTCDLHLVKSSNAKKKVARICIFEGDELNASFPTASFLHSGEICRSQRGLWSFWIKENQDQKVVVEVLTNLEVTDAPKLPTEPSRMPAEVLKWFQQETFGDVTIVAEDGKKFRCHRDILSARSDVFGLMFSCPMKESKENLVNIDGYEGDIVAQLLLFLYTDACEISSIADRLYSAAHQYQVDRLKSLCKHTLATSLSAKSVVKTYRLATFYTLDDLLAKCVEFLDTHKTELSIGDLLAEAFKLEGGNQGQVEQK